MANSPKYTLTRIIAACLRFGMPEDEMMRFFEILHTTKVPMGRPETRKRLPPVEAPGEPPQTTQESKPPEPTEDHWTKLLRLLGAPDDTIKSLGSRPTSPKSRPTSRPRRGRK